MKKIIPCCICLTLSTADMSAHAQSEECLQAYFNQVSTAHESCSVLAEQGDANAQKILGDMHFWGWADTIKRNYEESALWYKRAATNGQLDAKFALGVMYEQGKGVETDFERAYKWYLSAAREGHMTAQFNVANMLSKGAGVGKDEVKAVQWYRRAANQGDPEAQYNMGNWYVRGHAVEPNIVEAYMWYTVAAEQGMGDALQNIEVISADMTPDEITRAKRRAENFRVKSELEVRVVE